MLEPFTEGVIVGAALPDRYGLGTIQLPRLGLHERHFVHLRSGGVVDFWQQHLKVQIFAILRDMPPSRKKGNRGRSHQDSIAREETIALGVQVKSSQPEAKPLEALPNANGQDALRANGGEDIDTDGDDEDQGPFTVRTNRTSDADNADKLTPTTSQPTRTLKTTGIIEETPAKPAINEDDVLFSTASNKLQGAEVTILSSSAIPLDPNSPLARKGDSRAQASALVERMNDAVSSQDVFRKVGTPKRFQQTYGKRDRKANAGKPKRNARSSSLGTPIHASPKNPLESFVGISNGDEEGDTIDVTQFNVDKILPGDADVAEISEALNTSQAADEAASRSMGARRAKRKLPRAAENVELNDTSTSRKRGKRSANEERKTSLDTVDEVPAAPMPKPQKHANSSRVSRQEIVKAEEIVVAPRKSNHTTTQARVLRTGKTPTSSNTSSALIRTLPKVLTSHTNIGKNIKMVKFLRNRGVQIVEEVPTAGSNFICVTSSGEIHTTAKLLRSVALGKEIVTDEWVEQSEAAGELLATSDYFHKDLAPTKIADRRSLFKGKTLFFTTLLQQGYGKGWDDVKALATDAGAARVEKGTARKGAELTPRKDIIFFGNEKGDFDAISLVETEGKAVYHKDMLTQSILRGELLDNDEFKLQIAASGNGKSKKGRKER